MSTIETRRRHRRGLLLAAGAALAAVTLAVGMGATAQAATLFSDDFEDGNSSGWTTSGGTWSVTADGSQVYRQAGTSSDARALAGTTSWNNYSVQTRVKPTAFNGSNRFVAVLARVQSSTSYYYLALRSNNTVELKRLSGGSSTTLDTASVPVSLNTWYTLRLDVSGSSLRGYVNGTLLTEGTDSQYSAGRIGVATFNASANFDDVLVSDGVTTPTTPPTGGPTTTPPPTGNPGQNVADGWAGVNALGQNGTTGGAGGSTVTVSSASQFITEAASTGPKIIQVSGMIDLPGPMHEVSSDKTIVGLGSNSGFTGGGLNIGLPIDDGITSPPSNAVRNVILRNLNFRDWDDDAVNVQMFSHHIWIDHNTWTTGADGGVDIKRGSSYVTVSYNHADGTDKNMLLGHDDGNAAQDVGYLKVSYHHNFFDNTNQRNPRIRFGDQVHVYNNYYLNTGNYGVASTENAGVIVEGNYFENVDDPYHLGEGDSGDGRLVARNNCLINSGSGQTGGSVSNPSYSYTVQTACDMKSVVSAQAGVGRVGLPGGPTNSPATTAPPTTPPATTPPPTSSPPQTGLVGWATRNGGTTGGAGGPTVTVSSFADLRTQAEASGPRTILVNGMLSGSGTIEITAHKTIRGVGSTSGVSGTTLNIEDMSPANVIVQNLNIRGVPGGDAIQIENATNIWIDHNTLSSTIEDDVDFYDGMIDITHAGDYITVSWNIVRNHWKTSLVGHSDGNSSEDVGHLRITYHHNWFDRTFERSPRVRFGETVHVFNNYYLNVNHDSASYAIASTMDAGVLVEANVFENVQQACWSASGYADSEPGRLVARNNSLTNSGPCETNGSVAPVPYPYTAENVGAVKSSVTAGAGAGRITF